MLNRCRSGLKACQVGILILAFVLTSLGAWVLPSAPAWAGCSETCLDAAIEAADQACVDTFYSAGLQNLCQDSFRRSVDRLSQERLRCKREVLSLKGLGFANCRMSPEQILPGIQARRCVGQEALVDSLQSCDPDFQ